MALVPKREPLAVRPSETQAAKMPVAIPQTPEQAATVASNNAQRETLVQADGPTDG